MSVAMRIFQVPASAPSTVADSIDSFLLVEGATRKLTVVSLHVVDRTSTGLAKNVVVAVDTGLGLLRCRYFHRVTDLDQYLIGLPGHRVERIVTLQQETSRRLDADFLLAIYSAVPNPAGRAFWGISAGNIAPGAQGLVAVADDPSLTYLVANIGSGVWPVGIEGFVQVSEFGALEGHVGCP